MKVLIIFSIFGVFLAYSQIIQKTHCPNYSIEENFNADAVCKINKIYNI